MGVDVPDAQVFIEGFVSAVSLTYPDVDFQAVHAEVLKEHGWWDNTISAWRLMQEHGLTEDEIKRKLMDLHYEAWKRIAESLQPETTTTGNGVSK